MTCFDCVLSFLSYLILSHIPSPILFQTAAKSELLEPDQVGLRACACHQSSHAAHLVAGPCQAWSDWSRIKKSEVLSFKRLVAGVSALHLTRFRARSPKPHRGSCLTLVSQGHVNNSIAASYTSLQSPRLNTWVSTTPRPSQTHLVEMSTAVESCGNSNLSHLTPTYKKGQKLTEQPLPSSSLLLSLPNTKNHADIDMPRPTQGHRRSYDHSAGIHVDSSPSAVDVACQAFRLFSEAVSFNAALHWLNAMAKMKPPGQQTSVPMIRIHIRIHTHAHIYIYTYIQHF